MFTYNASEIIRKIISEEIPPSALKDKNHNFWIDTKISSFLDTIFQKFSEEIKHSKPLLRKSDYYILINYAKKDEIDSEVKEKLDKIYQIASENEKS